MNVVIHDLIGRDTVDLILRGLSCIFKASQNLFSSLCVELLLIMVIYDSFSSGSVDLILCNLLCIFKASHYFVSSLSVELLLNVVIHDLFSGVRVDFHLLNVVIHDFINCGSVDLVLCFLLCIFEASHDVFNGQSIEPILNSTELTCDCISCHSVGFLLLNVVIHDF